MIAQNIVKPNENAKLEDTTFNYRKLAFVNRQPTLWRHGIPVLEIVPSEDNDDTIGLSNLSLEPFNADIDGDAMAIYIIHDNNALKEMYDLAFLKNYVNYDQNNNFLATLRHEVLYSAYILTQSFKKFNESLTPITINALHELEENIELYNNIDTKVIFNNKEITYGLALFNKWCNFKDIKIDFGISKSQMNRFCKILYKYNNEDSGIYYDTISDLSKKLLFYITIVNDAPSIDLTDMIDVLSEEEEELFKKLPESNIP